MAVDKPAVVITGASTGIGRGILRVFVEADFLVFGTVRKDTDAHSLTAEFGDSVQPLLMDVTDEAAVAAAAKRVL